MSHELRAYNAQGEQLFITPDADGPQFESFETLGEAFDRMEALKSAYRWDSERAGYVAADGFVRNRIARFRFDDEEWTRAQVAAYAVKRAARKAALAERPAAEEEPQQAPAEEERSEEAAAQRVAAVEDCEARADSYELAVSAVRGFVRELPVGGALLVRTVDGTQAPVSREDLHALVYDNAGPQARAAAVVRVREAVRVHAVHGALPAYMLFPSRGMRPVLYLRALMAVVKRCEAVSAPVAAVERPAAPVAPVAAPKAVEAPLEPVTAEFATMADAVAFLAGLKIGERVRITKEGRTNDYSVTRTARRSGSQGTVNVTVSVRPGGYAFEVAADHLVANPTGGKATWSMGGTKMMRTPVEEPAVEAPVEEQRFDCCGCVSCSQGRGTCRKVPSGPAWGVKRPDSRVVGPFARHAEALRYGRNVAGGGTPVPLEPVNA
ncbi:hypothetical protein ACH4S8_37990 [Streptomyces sp. NPDC021080]|uniref:hypothetical protein n=1 Tax=Streptomyces sp. NPDC021080 TaxID=3365110 RepID=UPI0037B78F04